MHPPIHLDDIICYPLKGAGGFSLPEASLLVDRGLRHDRRFGLAFDETAPAELRTADKWKPWDYCHTLKKTAELARLSAHIRDAGDDTVIFKITATNGDTVEGCPADTNERAALEGFLQNALAAPTARLFDSEATPLWDDALPLTLLNSASVNALEEAENMSLTTVRFRANLVFSGLPAWREETLAGTVRINDARLTLAGGVPRCAATTVNPTTAQRDAKVPQMLHRLRSHTNMGVFAKVVEGGAIAIGEEIYFESA